MCGDRLIRGVGCVCGVRIIRGVGCVWGGSVNKGGQMCVWSLDNKGSCGVRIIRRVVGFG